MKQALFVLLIVCALSAAMVPRRRRALNSDEEEYSERPSTTKIEICAPQTPCGWSIYNAYTKMITMNITNTYCECRKGEQCIDHENDLSASAFVLRCRTSVETETTPES